MLSVVCLISSIDTPFNAKPLTDEEGSAVEVWVYGIEILSAHIICLGYVEACVSFLHSHHRET